MPPIESFVPLTRIAYFSMEIAIRPEMHTYAGGLGILAGDTARTAADLGLPMVFVTLMSREGYLRQGFDEDGAQVSGPDPWEPEAWAEPLDAKIAVRIEGRPVWIRPWLHVVESPLGGAVPVLLLDTRLEENAEADRALADRLYGGDAEYRLKQEIVLGMGGERVLRALEFDIATYHLNEGHAALLAAALLRRYPHPSGRVGGDGLLYDTDAVRAQCVFTTHTPVEAGIDRFDYALAFRLLDGILPQDHLRALAGADRLNMTCLALNLSKYVNGVAERHAETTRRMFPEFRIREVTNGIHSGTWAHPAIARLFDDVAPGWHHAPNLLIKADRIPEASVRAAHAAAKADLLAEVTRLSGVSLDPDRPLIAFARRMTGYKRPDLLFADPDRLRAIARRFGLQLVIAGKAHPRDAGGLDCVRAIHAHARALAPDLPVAFLPGYDMALARFLVAGADIWLNTPVPPMEASGTSGMKAGLNGVLNLSVLDGWWLEGWIEGETGWAIGAEGDDPAGHAAALYDTLERIVLPLHRDDPAGWARMMRESMSKIGGRFHSHGMMRRYATEAYLR